MDAVSYEGDVPGYTEASGTPADTDASNLGISRLPDGVDMDDNGADFSLSCITPGDTNADANASCPTPGDGGGGGNVDQCAELATLIHDVQRGGLASPLDSRSVTIEGVVVGDFQEGDGDAFDTDLDGFYVQEETDDYDPSAETSEGVFVFALSATSVNFGDVVRARGTVDGFNGMTEPTNVAGLVTCGTTTVPAPTVIPIKGAFIGEPISRLATAA